MCAMSCFLWARVFGEFGFWWIWWYLVVQLGVAGVGWACFVSAGFDSGICLLV